MVPRVVGGVWGGDLGVGWLPSAREAVIGPGARAHHTRPSNRAHAPPTTHNTNHTNPDAALAQASLHR